MDTADDNVDHPGHQAQRYCVSFPKSSRKIRCPVDGCPGTATTPYNLRRHFAHRHPTDTLTILEEGSAPLPKCERCGMHVTYLSLNMSHYNSTVCRAGGARERQRCAIQDACRAREVVFTVHGTQLEAVSEFRYLGRPFSSMDDDWQRCIGISAKHASSGRGLLVCFRGLEPVRAPQVCSTRL